MIEDLFAPDGYVTVPGILGDANRLKALQKAILAISKIRENEK